MNTLKLPKINSQRWLLLDDLQGEEWRDVEISPQYKISNYGRVKSPQRTTVYIRGGKQFYRTYKGKILRISLGNNYYFVGLKKTRNQKQKTYLIHRLIASAFIPNPENKPFVNHIDGNKLNNSIKNLEWCTYRENTDHAVKTDLVAFGSRSVKSKLKEMDVIAIKKYLAEGYTCKDIANKYSVHITTISCINTGKNWRRIPFPKYKQKCKLWNSVRQISQNGEVICEYESVMDAHRKTGYSTTQIYLACKGKRGLYKGFKWEYIKNDIKTFMEL